MEKIILDERLSAAAALVPGGAVLLDVGTDHGYLPAHLILEGRILRAGAADINKDPLSKAVATAEKYGISDSFSFYLSDGMKDVPDLSDYTAISVCGMGGELIARILDDVGHTKRKDVALVLQPMSSAEELSVYLAENGYCIRDEKVAFAAGKVYRVILAYYEGTPTSLSEVEHILGRVNIERADASPNFHMLLSKTAEKYKKIVSGKERGGIPADADREIIAEILKIAEMRGIVL